MAYPIITLESAKRAYALLEESVEPRWTEIEAQRGSGPLKDYYEVIKLEVEEVRQDFDFPLAKGAASKFESRIGIVLHENIREPEAVSDPDFWRWIALRPMLEATLDRHQSGDDDSIPKAANFGLGGPLENFAHRAWLRAEIGHDPAGEPNARYSLALRGDQDFWRSHLIRIRYAFHREMAHALIEFQYPTEHSNGILKKGDKLDGIRLLAKRLARTHANMAFPMLSKEECKWLISQLAIGLTREDGEKYTAVGAT